MNDPKPTNDNDPEPTWWRIACPRAVAAEVRATVASVLTSRRGTVYRFGAPVVAFDGAGAFYGVGVESYHGVAFEPARAKGAQW